jgi:hypothetical protein
MKVLVCGSRDWGDADAIAIRLNTFAVVHALEDRITLIHGAASRKIKGVEQSADMIAAYEAERLGFDVQAFPADWQTYGRRAGYLRNLTMLDQEPDLVIAFQRNNSRGTQHTIDEARRRGIPVEVHNA